MDGALKDLIATARERMKLASDADEENRERALDDLRNLSGIGQWPDDIRAQRERDLRVCVTVNQLPQFVRQVTGDIRQLNPGIKIIPGDDKADSEVAEVIEGLVRTIEYSSHASDIYEKAGEQAAECSQGAFRILTEYESETSFNQVIRIASIHNPLSVYWDPGARDSTRADAKFCFITSLMRRDEFKSKYPGKQMVDVEHDGVTDGAQYWSSGGDVVVAEYFWKEEKKVKLGLLANGQVVENPNKAMDLVDERDTIKTRIRWAKISGAEVLEGPTDIPGKHIPVIAVVGEELHVGREIIRTSVIRHAKDPQRLYNYAKSAEAEIIALQPKAPFIATVNQIAGHEKIWSTANQTNYSTLVYNPDPDADAPTRVAPPLASQGLSTQIQGAAMDMRSTTGIYDAGLGNAGAEKSGVAIRQRQMESDVSTSIYTDNLRKAIEHAGRVILGMIPEVYDTARKVRVTGPDGTETLEDINAPEIEFDGMQPRAVIKNDMTAGEYSVKVTVGPSYSTQRQEAAEGLLEFVKSIPQAGAVSADLIASNLDFPGADDLAKRLRKMLPPGMIEDQDQDPQALAQMQQQAQQQAAMQAAMQEAEVRKQMAEAEEAEADAKEAGLDVAKKQLELAAQSGQLDAVIQNAVARALQSALMGI